MPNQIWQFRNYKDSFPHIQMGMGDFDRDDCQQKDKVCFHLCYINRQRYNIPYIIVPSNKDYKYYQFIVDNIDLEELGFYVMENIDPYNLTKDGFNKTLIRRASVKDIEMFRE